jgi:hypothetical protein
MIMSVAAHRTASASPGERGGLVRVAAELVSVITDLLR